MRRPRKHLEVSTFPFLAVLLCAMGSLILILMVFDRRAKLAANERNRLAALAQLKERQEEIEQAQAKQAKALAGLSQQEKDAAQKLAATRNIKKQLSEREEELRKQLSSTQKKWEELDRWIKEAKERMADKSQRKDLLSQGVASDKKAANLAIEKFTQKQTELGRMSSEIIALKKILAELRTAPAKPVETYSIIPYFGKRGDARKPIYVECQASAYVFHPGALIVPLDDLHQFREQVNLRARVSASRNGMANASVPVQPYLLLLVRPEGIENYWKAQAMLRSDKLDFGYELIDGEWKLDFPEDPDLTRALRELPLGGSRLAANENGGLPGRSNRPGAFPGSGPNAPGSGGSSRTPQGIGRLGDPSQGGSFRGGQPGGSFGGSAPGQGSISGNPAGGGLAGRGADLGGPGGNGPGATGIPEFPRRPERSLGVGDLAGLLGPDVGGARGAGNGPIRGIPSGPDRDLGEGNSRPGFIGPGAGLGGNSSAGQGGNGNGGSGVSGMGPGGSGRSDGGDGQGARGTEGPGGASGNAATGNREFGLGRGNPGYGAPGSGGSGPGGPGGSSAGGPGAGGAGVGGVGSGDGGIGGNSGAGSKADLASGGGGAGGPEGQGAYGAPPGGGAGGAQGAAMAGGSPGDPMGGMGAGGGDGEGGAGGQGLSIVLNPEAKKEKTSRDDSDKPKKKPSYSVGAVMSGSPLEEESDGPNPLARVAAPDPLASEAATKKEPRPLRVARLDGSRDFILFIECNAQGIIVHPEKQKFAGHELETEAGAKRLLALMRQQIERKNKKTPAGETPPKGQIRFLVRAEGLRWYHASFPIIEDLQIKTTRQTLDPEDSVRDIILGASR